MRCALLRTHRLHQEIPGDAVVPWEHPQRRVSFRTMSSCKTPGMRDEGVERGEVVRGTER